MTTPMTAQDIFDKIVLALINQKEKSVDALTGSCRYRGPNNTKCAVGYLIPDDLYDPNMEGVSVDNILIQYPTINEMYVHHTFLLCKLQSAHDSSDFYNFLPCFLSQAKEIADEMNLVWKFQDYM